MDWIHCNDCFKQPHLNPDSVFVLTSCARIQCATCNVNNSCVQRHCESCRVQNYMTVPLDDKMPGPVEDFFRNPLDHLKKFIKVYDFQQKHRDRLAKHLAETQKEMASKTNEWQKSNSDLQSQLEKIMSENHSLKKDNTTLKQKIQQMEAQSIRPRSARDSRSDNQLNVSLTSSANDSVSDRNHFTMPPTRKATEHLPSHQQRNKRTYVSMKQADDPRPIRSSQTSARDYQQRPTNKERQGPFLNLETPGYFPSYRSAAVIGPESQVRRPAILPTPTLQRLGPVMVSTRKSSERPASADSGQRQKMNLPFINERVYAFMSAAAREALTPEPSKRP